MKYTNTPLHQPEVPLEAVSLLQGLSFPIPCSGGIGYVVVVISKYGAYVCRILHWQPNAGHTVSGQLLAEISQCVESINGVKGPKWKSTLSFYRPVIKDQSNASEFPCDFLGISLPDQPNKYYFVLRTHRLVLEADSSIQTIMEKLQSYKTRVALNFEGVQYQLGDFQLRIGKVASIQCSESIRGIV
ncbi:mediator of RNA polymerase II transcription subunit 20A, partial [Tanacetum coccineum]